MQPAAATALDITVSWGASVLRTIHLSPPRAFRLDDDDEVPLIDVRDGAVVLVVPALAPTTVRDATGMTRILRARSVEPLTSGSRARLSMRSLSIDVALGPKADIGPFFASARGAILGPFGASLMAHSLVLALLVIVMPPSLADTVMPDDGPRMATFEPSADGDGDDVSRGDRSAVPRRATGDDMRSLTQLLAEISSHAEPARLARGPTAGAPARAWDTPTPDPRRFLALLGGASDAASSFLDRGAADARGFWGDGTDRIPRLAGGGGRGGEMRLDAFIAFERPWRGLAEQGASSATCDDAPPSPCLGHGLGRGLRRHGVTRPSFRSAVPTIEGGKLPAETVRRIVHASSGRFLACYARGLQANPALAGRVVTKFTIHRDGAVVAAREAGSDMADITVVSCTVGAFLSLRFPTSDAGDVHVTYPITFSSTD